MSEKSKRTPIYGLEKIPEKAWIKILEKHVRELKVEIGKNESRIQELEYLLENKEKLTDEELQEIKKQTAYQKIQKERDDLKYKIYALTRDNKKLIEKNINLKRKLDEYEKK